MGTDTGQRRIAVLAMTDHFTLRAVDSESPPLTPAELKKRGGELASDARRAAIDAVRKSMHSEFLERGVTLGHSDILRWRGRARSALEAWREVDAITTELLNEIKKTKGAS